MTSNLIIIAGATGFIGRALVQHLSRAGWEVAILTRDRNKGREIFGDRHLLIEWDGRTAEGWQDFASRARAFVNLVGENIGAGRWTSEQKKRLVESRLNAGRAICLALSGVASKSQTLVQASAIGFYGFQTDRELDESAPPGEGFLAELARRWEDSTKEVEGLGVRRVIIRSGVVLDSDGGVLPRFLKPFRCFVGGSLGSGRQWLSWIHRQDEVRAIRFVLENGSLSGPFNLSSPLPVRMKDFAQTLGRVMKRPSFLRLPSFFLRFLFGQMAEETILGGQKAMPRALLANGFHFLYPELEGALRKILADEQLGD